VIESFWHRGLRELFETGRSARVRPDLHRRALVRLDAIDKAARLGALNQPGFDFHPLRGLWPRRYSIHVNGPWRITFEWRNGRALRVDLEQYTTEEQNIVRRDIANCFETPGIPGAPPAAPGACASRHADA
jgi:proteic killer suppression protein